MLYDLVFWLFMVLIAVECVGIILALRQRRRVKKAEKFATNTLAAGVLSANELREILRKETEDGI